MLGLAAALLLLGSGCGREKIVKNGRVTHAQAQDYLKAAIRQSSEGVVLDPSQTGLRQIEKTRLGEIAQELRAPAARCFLERAIETMEMGEVDGEEAWVSVPEGQAKFRARISVDGTVLATDVLESGFKDDHMETCLSDVITRQRFVESRDSFAYHVDVYYWVSLGFFAEASTKEFAEYLRRQQAQAALRALSCLQGRVRPGTYTVRGLNLFDRDGHTVINRIDNGTLPVDVATCVASTFKHISIHEEPDAFIRPAQPTAEFTVAADGTVSFADQRWLELIVLEEQAAREKRKAELLGEVGEDEPDGFIDVGEPEDEPPAPIDMGRGSAPPPKPEAKVEPKVEPKPKVEPPKPESEPPKPEATQPKPPPTGDPSKPGTKIDLSTRRGR